MVCPTRSLISWENRSDERLLADPSDALGGQLEPALALVDEPGLGQLLGHLGQPVEGAGGVLAEAAAHLVDVHLGQRAGELADRR